MRDYWSYDLYNTSTEEVEATETTTPPTAAADRDKERRQGFIAYGVLLVVSAIIGYGLLVSIAGAWR